MSESRVAMGCGIGAVLAVAPCPGVDERHGHVEAAG